LLADLRDREELRLLLPFFARGWSPRRFSLEGLLELEQRALELFEGLVGPLEGSPEVLFGLRVDLAHLPG
jgi:hypothetical protein